MQHILEECTGKKKQTKKKERKSVTVCSNPTCMQTTPIANTMAFRYRQRIQKEDDFRPFSLTAGPKQSHRFTPRKSLRANVHSFPLYLWTTGGRSKEKDSAEAGSQLHLFSMSVCTLCTSSRAILRMCCTSCRSAISIRQIKRHIVTTDLIDCC